MPKAILELEMPENCWDCKLRTIWGVCIVLLGNDTGALIPRKGRWADCPLKLVDVDALEKQKPKKVELSKSKFHYGNCPTCGRLYWDKEHIGNYCDQCGQRLEVES